jgi:hypothetical protein
MSRELHPAVVDRNLYDRHPIINAGYSLAYLPFNCSNRHVQVLADHRPRTHTTTVPANDYSAQYT